MDLAIEPKGQLWTRQTVGEELVLAFRTLRNAPSSGFGPKPPGSAWPAVLQTFAEAVGAEEIRDTSKWAWSHSRPAPSTAAITRMEEALTWPAVYLKDANGYARCIGVWVICKAARRPWLPQIRRRGWPKSTFERNVARGLDMIANGLNGRAK